MSKREQAERIFCPPTIKRGERTLEKTRGRTSQEMQLLLPSIDRFFSMSVSTLDDVFNSFDQADDEDDNELGDHDVKE